MDRGSAVALPAPSGWKPALIVAALVAVALLFGAAPARATPSFAIDESMARVILFAADGGPPEGAERCASGTRQAQIDCLLSLRFAADTKAARVARELYAATGAVAGLLPAQDFDGEYRGKLKLVPHLPVHGERQHLKWLADALKDIDGFFTSLQERGTLAYHWTDFDVRFFRSVKRRTPSAVAQGWRISYNVSGSLFTTPARVRETLFHEIFHLNDDEAGGRWSVRALDGIYRRIVVTCGVHNLKCLEPYAPDPLLVRVTGGTYSAFMPDNGVTEYAADLAKRYYVEQRAVLHDETVARPFKCRTRENAEAWQLLVDKWFGGVDLVPSCPT
ncbi:MAG: hypothetical protein IT382_06915 [Deltaproteobacteria bacterium]|nr:hypothetical protein [Deltaproteobacteria bacterium]